MLDVAIPRSRRPRDVVIYWSRGPLATSCSLLCPQYALSMVMVALGDNVFQLIDYVSFVLWSMVGGAVAGQLWWR